jgi:hypothetical protein
VPIRRCPDLFKITGFLQGRPSPTVDCQLEPNDTAMGDGDLGTGPTARRGAPASVLERTAAEPVSHGRPWCCSWCEILGIEEEIQV